MPLTSSEAIDAAAWLIAQPWPSKRTSSTRAVVADAQHDLQLVAAQRVGVLELEVRGRPSRPSCAGACSARGSPRGTGRPSGEDLPDLGEAGDQARRRPRACCGRRRTRAMVAPTPRRCMSGCAQWWPARTQTPCAAEDLGDVVRVDAVERERDERAAVRRRRAGRGACRPGTAREALERVGRRARARASRTVLHADALQEVDRGAEADGLGDRRRAGLELRRAARAQRVPPRARPRRSCARRRGTAASRRAARGGRAGRRCRSARRPCGRSRRRSRRRSRARSTGICGTACEPSTTTIAPAACARRDDLRDRVDRARRRWRRARRRRP